jgi:tetratricopeptide (TPR) repeat protein
VRCRCHKRRRVTRVFAPLALLAQIFLSGWMALAQQESKHAPAVSLAPERPQQIVPPLTQEAQDPLLLRAHQAAEEGSFANGDATVREFLRQRPSSADAHYLLGYILYRELRAKESLSEYTLAARGRKPTALELEIVALDYVLLGDFIDADRWLTRSLSWEPANALGWYYLGRAKYNENRFAEAIDAFNACLKLEPRNVKAEDNIGLSEQGLNHPEEAARAFQLAISWQEGANEKNAQPFLNLGSLLTDQGNADAGLPYLLNATEMAPRNAKGHEELGRAYAKLKQLKNAQAELEKAVQLAPNSSSVRFQLAMTYREQGLKEQAKQEFDRCAALNAAHSSVETPNQ